MRLSRVVLAGLFAASLPLATMAHAQPSDRAQTLFDDAKQLAAANRHAEACPRLEQSLALDPALGTMFNLADCYEHVGKIASAWRLFARVEAGAHAAAQADREIRAHDRAAALANRVARITVTVPPEGRIPGLEVIRDGEMVAPATYGVAIPVDLGQHAIEARAPGRAPWRRAVTVASNGTLLVVDVPRLSEEGPPRNEASARSPAPAAPASRSRTLPFVIGGVGIVGLATGGIFGGMSLAKHAECTGPCVGSDRDRQSQAYVFGNVSTVAFGVGAAALVVSAVLLLTGSGETPTSAAASR